MKRIKGDILLLDSLSGRKGNICVIMNADRKPVYGSKLDQKPTILLSDLELSRYDMIFYKMQFRENTD